MLYGMFERQQDVSDATANDLKRAYARLLSGANLTGNDPNVCHPVVWHDGGHTVLSTPWFIGRNATCA